MVNVQVSVFVLSRETFTKQDVCSEIMKRRHICANVFDRKLPVAKEGENVKKFLNWPKLFYCQPICLHCTCVLT